MPDIQKIWCIEKYLACCNMKALITELLFHVSQTSPELLNSRVLATFSTRMLFCIWKTLLMCYWKSTSDDSFLLSNGTVTFHAFSHVMTSNIKSLLTKLLSWPSVTEGTKRWQMRGNFLPSAEALNEGQKTWQNNNIKGQESTTEYSLWHWSQVDPAWYWKPACHVFKANFLAE